MGEVPLHQVLSAVQRFLADTRVLVRDAALTCPSIRLYSNLCPSIRLSTIYSTISAHLLDHSYQVLNIPSYTGFYPQVLGAVQRFLADPRVLVRDAALAAFLALTAKPATKAGIDPG